MLPWDPAEFGCQINEVRVALHCVEDALRFEGKSAAGQNDQDCRFRSRRWMAAPVFA